MKDESKPGSFLIIRLHFLLALILFFHAVFFLVYWFSIGRLRGEVDLFVSNVTKFSLPYTTILILLSAGIGIWSLFRLVSSRLALRSVNRNVFTPGWLYFTAFVAFICLFYISFFLIFRENPGQKGVVYQLVNLTRLVTDPIIFLVSAIWLRRLILLFRRKAKQAKKRWLWGMGVGFALALLVSLWLIAAVLPPNWAYKGDLPAKPALIAHRGASMLAPENTLAAVELADAYGAFGFETDLRISLDGVPYLMHDSTLQRTTNIAEVFPDRAGEHSSSFTMEELRMLNAGLWFIQSDPYSTIDSGLISQAQLSINQGQEIPTLEQALASVREKGMIILFDLRSPPQEHPYHEEFFKIVFDQLKESGINGNIWFLVDRQNIDFVLESAPQMTRVIGVSSTNLPDPMTLIELNYEIVNVDTGIVKKDIQAYRQQGLGVNVYTIDQPWLFSQLWLSGVTSVTTNNIQGLSQLDRPFIDLPYSRFLLFWALIGIIVAIWLASSQPVRTQQKDSDKLNEPDLMDFVMQKDQDK